MAEIDRRLPLVLASSSPRRLTLLRTAGISVEAVVPPRVAEVRRPGEPPERYAARLAREKASAVRVPGAWILAADTVVHIDGTVFDKPIDRKDAVRILRSLSGRWHRVTTAWRVAWGGPDARRARSGKVTTAVRFRRLSQAEILHYVGSGEGADKAGGYGIQELGVLLIDRVDGSFTNVVGLPMDPVLRALDSVGIRPQEPPWEP